MKSNEELIASRNEKPDSRLDSSLSRFLGEENTIQESRGRRDTADEGAQPACIENARDRHLREALLHAVVSPIPKDILRLYIIGDDNNIGQRRTEAFSKNHSSNSTLGQINRKEGLGTSTGNQNVVPEDCDNEHQANRTSNCKARAAGSSPAVQQANFGQAHSYKIRIPYSDRIITLQRGPADACAERSLPRPLRTSRSGKALPGEAAYRYCFPFTSTQLCRRKHIDVLPESHICGQLLREVASRIQSTIILSEHPLMLSTQGSDIINEEEKFTVQTRPEVKELSALYARLLLFDQHLLLSWSQWWRFQKCEEEDEHASQHPSVKPFFTLLHVIPKLRRVSCFRPSIIPHRVQPYIKISVDLMHVCLTAHYLFGEEDVLAQELLRMYEVYCFLNNTRSGEQLTPRLRNAIQYTEEIRQKLGFPCLSPLVAVARGESVTPSMNEELRQAEVFVHDTRYNHPQRWKQWIQHLQCRRQLRLQRDGEALLFRKCEEELEMKWLQIVRLRQSKGFSQSNLQMKVVYIHSDAENDVNTLQMEILAEAEELFYYYVDQTGKRSSLLVSGESPRGEAPETCPTPGPSDRFWPFDLTEFVEAISFKFEIQGRRQPGQPLRRLLLTQPPHSVDSRQVIPPTEQARRLLASSLLSSISCKINGRALSRRAHIPLNVPSFASSSGHILPPWDLNASTAAVAALAGSVPGEPHEISAHTFGTLLAEPLSDVSFDVELHHAGLNIPSIATTRMPIAPELSLLTRCPPPPKEERKTKDVLVPEVNGGSPPLLSHPVTIYVDVPFSYRREKNCRQDIHDLNTDEIVSTTHVSSARQGTERDEEESRRRNVRGNYVSLDSLGEGSIRQGVIAPKSQCFPSDRATRVRQNRISCLKSNTQQGQKRLFLMEQTQLRLSAAEWDQENAAGAKAEALNMAAALAAEVEAEVFMKAADATAAAEPARDVTIVQKNIPERRHHQVNRGCHHWRIFKLRGQNANQQSSTAVFEGSSKRAPVSSSGVVAAGGEDDASLLRESRRHRAYNSSKRRSVAEEEQIEIEQEAIRVPRASILASRKKSFETPQMPEQGSTQPEKGHLSSRSNSIDGNGEAAVVDGHTERGQRIGHSSKKKLKKHSKARASKVQVAYNQDSVFDEARVPTFATDGKHSSAPNDCAGLPFSLRGGERQYPAFSTGTVPDASGTFRRTYTTIVGPSVEPPHIRTYSSTGSLLPPPPVRVRRAIKFSRFSNKNGNTRLEGVQSFCRQQGEQSSGSPSSPFPQLPPFARMGDMTEEHLALRGTRPTIHDQPDLVQFSKADWSSPSPGLETLVKYYTRDGGESTVLADQWVERIPTSPSTQDSAAMQVIQEQTNRQIPLSRANSSHEGAHRFSQKSAGPLFRTPKNIESDYENGKVSQAQSNVFDEAAKMINHSESRSHLSGDPNEGSEDFSVFLDNAEREVNESSESFEGCLKLRVTLAPAPRESTAGALLEGLEAFTLQRHQLECKINACSSLTTLMRRLPTTPAEVQDHRLSDENDYFFSAAAAALEALPLDAAYSYGLQSPSSSTIVASGFLYPQKLAQQLHETFLHRSRPLNACVRLTLLLTIVRGSSGTCKAAWTLNHWSAGILVDGTFTKKLLEQWRGAIPSLDSESWLLLQTAEEEAVRQHYKDSCKLETFTNAAEPEDDDEDELDKKLAEDCYVMTLKSALLASLPKQAAVVLSASESPPFSAVVREVTPGLDLKLLFRNISLSCCMDPLLKFSRFVELGQRKLEEARFTDRTAAKKQPRGHILLQPCKPMILSRYLESQTARRRTTTMETEDKSLGVFLKVRRLYNVPVREEPLSLKQWHHRHEMMERSVVDTPRHSGGVKLCAEGFNLHGMPTESSYARERRVPPFGRMSQLKENGFAANSTQLSNVVVELKYVNRSTGVEAIAATKAVSGENPVINQLIHLQLPSGTEADAPTFDDLVTQDSFLIMNVFDQPQRNYGGLVHVVASLEK